MTAYIHIYNRGIVLNSDDHHPFYPPHHPPNYHFHNQRPSPALGIIPYIHSLLPPPSCFSPPHLKRPLHPNRQIPPLTLQRPDNLHHLLLRLRPPTPLLLLRQILPTGQPRFRRLGLGIHGGSLGRASRVGKVGAQDVEVRAVGGLRVGDA